MVRAESLTSVRTCEFDGQKGGDCTSRTSTGASPDDALLTIPRSAKLISEMKMRESLAYKLVAASARNSSPQDQHSSVVTLLGATKQARRLGREESPTRRVIRCRPATCVHKEN